MTGECLNTPRSPMKNKGGVALLQPIEDSTGERWTGS